MAADDPAAQDLRPSASQACCLQQGDPDLPKFGKTADESPQGYLDRRLVMRYRKEVLEPGASKDVNESVLAFTGQPPDRKPVGTSP